MIKLNTLTAEIIIAQADYNAIPTSKKRKYIASLERKIQRDLR